MSHVERCVLNYLASDFNTDNESLSEGISLEEIYRAGKRLKVGKAPGLDGITNEHILFGGPTLIEYLRILFDSMLLTQYTPKAFRVGITVPIYKEDKPREAAKSYRPVTLLSSIFKVFESIIKQRFENELLRANVTFPDIQQNAYQPHVGSLTVSFNLQEAVHHNRELGNDTYVAFMDAASAFDSVWHDGLFYKMIQIGIKGRALVWLINCYKSMCGRVLVNGVMSDSFIISQGIRQGGVLSSWCYLL